MRFSLGVKRYGGRQQPSRVTANKSDGRGVRRRMAGETIGGGDQVGEVLLARDALPLGNVFLGPRK